MRDPRHVDGWIYPDRGGIQGLYCGGVGQHSAPMRRLCSTYLEQHIYNLVRPGLKVPYVIISIREKFPEDIDSHDA